MAKGETDLSQANTLAQQLNLKAADGLSVSGNSVTCKKTSYDLARTGTSDTISNSVCSDLVVGVLAQPLYRGSLGAMFRRDQS